MIPDITSPKVLYPTILFYILNEYVHTNPLYKGLLFGALYYASLKLFSHVVFTKNDIIMTNLIFYIFNLFKMKLIDATVVFMFAVALIRYYFPTLYY